MMITMVLWIWMAALSYIYGSMTKRFLQKIFSLKNDDLPFPVLMILGLCALGMTAGWISLFLKTGLLANVLISLAGAFYALLDHRYFISDLKSQRKLMRGMDPFVFFSMLGVLVLVLMETSLFVPKNYDTAIYHAQAIRWSEGFPALPGLGNLHNRLAYNSVWLVLNALFSFSFLKIQSFHVLNGFLMSVSMLYFFLLLPRSGEKKTTLAGIFSLVLIPVSYYIQVNFISSPGTDAPAVFMILAVLLYYLASLEKKEGREDWTGPVILFVSCFLITVKLSTIPVIVIPLLLFLKDLVSRRFLRVGAACLVAAMVIAPWLARNVVISGYLVYPYASLDLFHVDWKMPKSVLQDDTRYIRAWSNAYNSGDVFHYLVQWLVSLRLQYRVIVYPALVFWLTGVVWLIARLAGERGGRMKLLREKRAIAVLYIMSYAAIAYLFLTAPDVRYGSVFFIIFGLLHVLPILPEKKGKEKRGEFFIRAYSVLLFAGLVLFEVFLFNRYFNTDPSRGFTTYQVENIGVLEKRVLLPADYPTNTSVISAHLMSGKLTYYTPSVVDLSWYDPFPTVPRERPDVRLRSDDVKSGFRMK